MQQNPLSSENLGNWCHTFPIVLVLFSHPIPILWYTSAYGKCIGFSINFPERGKMQQNSLRREKLGNWYSYVSHSMDGFFHQISILLYTSSYGKCMGFLISFSQHGKRQQNPPNMERLRSWFPYSFHSMGIFSIKFSSFVFPIIFPNFVICEMHRQVGIFRHK